MGHQPLFPSAAEMWADAVVHALGIAFAIGAVVYLCRQGLAMESGFALIAYGAGMAAMLGTSAAYNLWSGPAKEIWRRFDHAMIYVMIAGSYTPFVVLRLHGSTAALLGGVVWTGALAGVVLKLAFPRRFERLSLALYLGLGWALVLGFDSLINSLTGTTLTLLLVGGVLYTLGVPLHLAHRMRFHTAAWHACVLAGTICHFAAITAEFA